MVLAGSANLPSTALPSMNELDQGRIAFYALWRLRIAPSPMLALALPPFLTLFPPFPAVLHTSLPRKVRLIAVRHACSATNARTRPKVSISSTLPDYATHVVCGTQTVSRLMPKYSRPTSAPSRNTAGAHGKSSAHGPTCLCAGKPSRPLGTNGTRCASSQERAPHSNGE